MQQANYERVTVERVSPLYQYLKVDPVLGLYQVWAKLNEEEFLAKADPLGLLFYTIEGEIEDDTNYWDIAAVLDVPYAYVVGFDIAYEGELPHEQIEAAELDVDLDDIDLWFGAVDGLACRQRFVEQEVA